MRTKGRYPTATALGAGTVHVTNYRHPHPTVPSVHHSSEQSDVPSKLPSTTTPATLKTLNATSTAPSPPEMEAPRVVTGSRAFSKTTPPAELQTTRSKPPTAVTMMSTTGGGTQQLDSQKSFATPKTPNATTTPISGMHTEDPARTVKYSTTKGSYPKVTGQGTVSSNNFRHPPPEAPTVPSMHLSTNSWELSATPKSPNTTTEPISEAPIRILNNFTKVAQTTGRHPPAMVQGAFTYSRQLPRAPITTMLTSEMEQPKVETSHRAFYETPSPVVLPIPLPKPPTVPDSILPSSGLSEDSHVPYQTPGLSQTTAIQMTDVHTEDLTPLPKDNKARRDPPTMVYEAVTAKPQMTTARLQSENGDGVSEFPPWTHKQPVLSTQQSNGPDFELKPPNTTPSTPKELSKEERIAHSMVVFPGLQFGLRWYRLRRWPA
ncbi:hypothetical protein Bbelb_149420 [Branchiostoma belcheri]|nr:hypothetical protein Bbelb_149420 [Branchiostoma belcheri]